MRAASEEKLIITNGFSCHEQIVQQTDRRPIHIAEVLQMVKQSGTITTPSRHSDIKNQPYQPAEKTERVGPPVSGRPIKAR
jgi:hypothetical protein